MPSRWVCSVLALCLVLAGCGTTAAPPATATPDPLAQTLASFEVDLEAVRQELKIPGMSAAVVKDGQLVWARGFGYADVENKVAATPDTPYHLASVTKTSAAVVVMQLVQEGQLSLDDPVSRYGVTLPEGDRVLVRHLLSHTSEGTPGARFHYNGNRYGMLSQVVLAAGGRARAAGVVERVLSPLGMDNTAPGPPATCAGLSFAPDCERVHAVLARPYMLDGDLNPVPGFCMDSFNAGAGLISTVVDLARFDAALDANTLVTAATQELMWAPTVSNSGQKLPYGLGWFTQDYRGTRLIWHSGFSPPSTSALFLKLPEEGLTFIVLANTDLLSRHYPSTDGDVMKSLLAVTFYKHLMLAPQYDLLPAIDWSQDSSAVLTAISRVQDQAVQDLLSKEFQARSALANALADIKAQLKRLDTMRATAATLAETQDPQTLNRYAGTYEFADAGGLILTVSQVENKLYIRPPGDAEQELLPLSATRFFIPFGYDFYELEFVSDPAGGAPRLVLSLYGMSFTGRRRSDG